MNYDVIIIGGGPAGIFTALELAKNSNLSILLLEKGKELEARHCPSREEKKMCIHCSPCSTLCGWGGAGAFSDGKLTLSTEVGGTLTEFISEKEVEEVINYTDSIFVSFGAPREIFGTDNNKIEDLSRKATKAGLKLIPSKIRHLGTEICYEVLKNIHDEIKSRVDIKTRTAVKKIVTQKDNDKEFATGVITNRNEEIKGKYVVLAPGREGSDWLKDEITRFGLETSTNYVDIGVRVEVPGVVMQELTDAVYEAKLVFYSKSFDDKVRTFCMNPFGEVVTEYSDGVVTVNGHSYSHKISNNTNFAVLVSTKFTEPFKEPIAYGKDIARLANLLGGGVIVQRLGDLHTGRRSTEERIKRSTVIPTLKGATPGDLSFVLPYRYLSGILEMLSALDNLAPGVNSRDTLLYGVEVKFYSLKLKLKQSLETSIDNLFAIGDGAGVTRGLIQASATGVLAAREIIKRNNRR